MERLYKSKIDAWLLGIVILTLVIVLGLPFFTFSQVGFAALPSSLIAILAGAGLPLWVFTSTSYRLTDTTLYVKSGPFKWEVPIREITKITPTRDALSSPALSLDRLRIEYGRRQSLMISPKDKQQFIADLEARRKRQAGVN